MKLPPLLVTLIAACLTATTLAADGWRELFNGKDLNGWKANVLPESWTVKDGVIRANATKPSSHLFYVGDKKEGLENFKDFELEVETRSEPNSNSGIFIHTDMTGGGDAMHLSKGYEIQLNSSVVEKRKTGSLYAVVDLDKSPVDESQWFKVLITVRGQRITIQANGQQVVDYTEPPNVVRPKDRAGRKLNPAGGAIALQAHDPQSVFYFKSVRIRPLLAQSPPKDSPKKSAAAGANYDESKIVPYTLPDLFTLADGAKVTTSVVWERQRRGELLEIFRREVYGIAPPKPETLAFRVVESDPQAMDGKATRKQVAISFQLGGETFTFHVILFVPNQRTAPAPVFLLLNHRPITNTDPTRQTRSDFWPAEEVIARGYAIAAINVSAEVEPDKRDATTGIRVFYRQHFAKPDELTWGALAAWAWAGSRALDYLETDADVNAAQVAVIGHSRTGKTALWAAAADTRFALACANGAGEGGPALARRNFGETLGQITTSFPYWFTPKYATYADKVETLPIDQHEFIALVAPRGYHGGDGTRDSWADPRGSWLSLLEASKVWAMFGKTAAWQGEMPPVNELRMDGPLAYHIREGGHDLTAFDWKLYLDHADQHFHRAPAK